MSSDAWIVSGITGLYLAASVVIGLLPGKKASATATGFVAGDRGLGLFVMYFITGATVFSAFAFLGGPGWAYSRGAAAFYILAYGALGFVPFYFLAPRASRVGRVFGYVTQGEMVGGRFGSRRLTGLMAIVSVAALMPYLALQMKGAGTVVSVVSEGRLSAPLGAAIVYSLVLIYVMKSGVLGVGWTNTFQGIFMMVLAWGLGLYLPYALYGGVGEMFTQIEATRPELLRAPGLTKSGEPWTWLGYGSAVLISIVGFTAWPHLFMKSFSAANEKVLRLTAVLYPTFQIFLIPLFLIGFAGVLFESKPEDPDEILPFLLMNMDVSSVLVGLFCAGALAASMSSGDAMAHATASIAVRDGIIRGMGLSLGSRAQRTAIRFAIVVVMVGAYSIAVSSSLSLVAMLLSAYGLVVQLMPGVLATLYWRRASEGGIFWGMLFGMSVTLILSFSPHLDITPIQPGALGLLINVPILIVASCLSPVAREVDPFLKVAQHEVK